MATRSSTLLIMIASLGVIGARAFNTAAFVKRVAHANFRPRRPSLVVREMCGLVAAVHDVWSPDASPPKEEAIFSPDVLHTTSQILSHRGPDGMQIHCDGQFGMGHTRLAIVDPENRKADMPFQLEFDERTIHLAANGEIYNHEELYKNIEDPYPLLSHSDCEVIGHVYAKYGGPKAASMLDGMFAFVIFEEVDGEIKHAFAARDPVGIKPLYYGKTKQGSYIFASELKALVGHVDPATVVNVPAGHYWTPEEGLVCYYNPEWLRNVSVTHVFDDVLSLWSSESRSHQLASFASYCRMTMLLGKILTILLPTTKFELPLPRLCKSE